MPIADNIAQRPCKRGHVSDRYPNRTCKECNRLRYVPSAAPKFDPNTCKRGHAAKRNARGQCPECVKVWDAAFKARSPDYHESYLKKYRAREAEKYMLWAARERARKNGLACTITVDDIVSPEFCPLLGIKLERGAGVGGHGPRSPSLDRIRPDLGYVPGNVWVISHRANTLKNDASLTELETLVENLRRTLWPWQTAA